VRRQSPRTHRRRRRRRRRAFAFAIAFAFASSAVGRRAHLGRRARGHGLAEALGLGTARHGLGGLQAGEFNSLCDVVRRASSSSVPYRPRARERERGSRSRASPRWCASPRCASRARALEIARDRDGARKYARRRRRRRRTLIADMVVREECVYFSDARVVRHVHLASSCASMWGVWMTGGGGVYRTMCLSKPIYSIYDGGLGIDIHRPCGG